MESGFQIRLSADLTSAHSAVLRTYLGGAQQLSRDDWRTLRTAVDLLSQCQVEFQGKTYTFSHFYGAFLDAGRAPKLLEKLYQLTDLSKEGPALQAQNAREILTWLTEKGLYGPDAGDASLLVIYCLYRWASFASGHIFQMTVFQDLSASAIRCKLHDPRISEERFADHDLVLLGFKGDVKQSLYFLDALPRSTLSVDFYLTQMYDRGIRRQRWIALMHERMWSSLNGRTIPDWLTDATQWFPDPVSITLQQETWIVMAYEAWKSYILSIQTRGGQ